MNTNFDLYSEYYDLLYKDKNYDEESEYLRGLLNEYAIPGMTSILELGCGTGMHACKLAESGFRVTGIDLSDTMLNKARNRANSLNLSNTPSFQIGDARSFRTDEKFDAVMALFHVASYQTSDNDFQEMLNTAHAHLNPGGVFIFDFWYGPSVLWERPSLRVKRLSNDEIKITRIAEPIVYSDSNLVDVNYTIFIERETTAEIQAIKETHKMRYFFLPEISNFLNSTGFELVLSEEWVTKNTPSVQSWGVNIIARKR